VTEAPLYLTFRAAGSRFAIPLERVRGAYRPKRIAPLPGAPESYAGVALVKGEAIGVIDARRALRAEGEEGAGGETCATRPVLLLFEGDGRALLVDRVDEIEAIAEGSVGPAPPGARNIRGVVEGGGRTLSLLDVDRVLGGGV
jgi:purine-binding chemotaxis protein CheW